MIEFLRIKTAGHNQQTKPPDESPLTSDFSNWLINGEDVQDEATATPMAFDCLPILPIFPVIQIDGMPQAALGQNMLPDLIAPNLVTEEIPLDPSDVAQTVAAAIVKGLAPVKDVNQLQFADESDATPLLSVRPNLKSLPPETTQVSDPFNSLTTPVAPLILDATQQPSKHLTADYEALPRAALDNTAVAAFTVDEPRSIQTELDKVRTFDRAVAPSTDQKKAENQFAILAPIPQPLQASDVTDSVRKFPSLDPILRTQKEGNAVLPKDAGIRSDPHVSAAIVSFNTVEVGKAGRIYHDANPAATPRHADTETPSPFGRQSLVADAFQTIEGTPAQRTPVDLSAAQFGARGDEQQTQTDSSTLQSNTSQADVSPLRSVDATLAQSRPPPITPASLHHQLLQHAPAATDRQVEVLLAPEELGSVKFQIRHHGETVSILLSAERGETLDLLRRHGDELMREFRQAGFAGATLDFGSWGQQPNSQHKPASNFGMLDDSDPRSPAQRPNSVPSFTGDAQGLNIRL